VVGVQVGEEYRVQPGEVQSRRGEGRRRPAAAVTTKTRPATMSADEIPPRPGTGIGAPAVPSKTSSVAMSDSLSYLTSSLSTADR